MSMKEKSEKEILGILSDEIGKDMPDVWNKISSGQKSRFSDIECEIPEPIKSQKKLSLKMISSIAAVFVVLLTGIYLSLFHGGGFSKMNGNVTKMAADPRFYVVENNNKLYYQDFTDDCKLYNMDFNGQNRKKLYDDYVANIATDGEYIYYKNLADEKEYRIKIDGTGRELLTEVGENLNFSGSYMYFTRDSGIFKANKTGKDIEKIADASAINTLTLYAGSLYFSGVPANTTEGLYKMDLNGSGLKKISDKAPYVLKILDDWIFFQSAGDNNLHYIYKIGLDGSGEQKLSNNGSNIETFEVKDKNIYFISSENSVPSLYKMDTTGANITKILDNFEATTIKAIGNKVYCFHPSYDGRLFKIDMDGKTKTEILSNYNKNRTEK